MEKIYTIPVNEAFEECAEDPALGCPFCRLYNKLECDQLDLILGASMMEPDVRIKTNEAGFCATHFNMMTERKNRLGLALMLESHLNKVRGDFGKGSFTEKEAPKLEASCYLCSRIDGALDKMLENAVWLWDADSSFDAKLRAQPYICLLHYRAFSEAAKKSLNRKKFAAFSESLKSATAAYFDSLCGDVSWFCRKFDYRYADDPWGNAKDSPDRAVKFLSGDLHRPYIRKEKKNNF